MPLFISVDSASELNTLTLAYAITVHKSQGSEAQKVFLFLHQSHNTMCQRELLYTAVTRARKELYVICEKDTFTKGVISQKIKGTTLQEKLEYFKGKALNTTVTIL
jgi:exodeoxyribonuclease V alpha subunit